MEKKFEDLPLMAIRQKLRWIYGAYKYRIVKADYRTLVRHEVYLRLTKGYWKYIGNLEEGIDLQGKIVRVTK